MTRDELIEELAEIITDGIIDDDSSKQTAQRFLPIFSKYISEFENPYGAETDYLRLSRNGFEQFRLAILKDLEG
jgi:hypothetical protein